MKVLALKPAGFEIFDFVVGLYKENTKQEDYYLVECTLTEVYRKIFEKSYFRFCDEVIQLLDDPSICDKFYFWIPVTLDHFFQAFSYDLSCINRGVLFIKSVNANYIRFDSIEINDLTELKNFCLDKSKINNTVDYLPGCFPVRF